MAFFPELLYQLSARDAQVTWSDLVNDGLQGQAAAVSVSSVYVVPRARALLLQAASIRAFPGAAQINNQLGLLILRPNEVSVVEPRIALIWRQVSAMWNPAANDPTFVEWQGSIIIPPLWSLMGFGSFSAGAALNTLQLTVNGMLIPVGNMMR